jgi:hypothetical protein
MHLSFQQAALWPLRPLGLNPGRAIQNANPTAEQAQARRAEQHAYIAARFGVPEAFDGSQRGSVARIER